MGVHRLERTATGAGPVFSGRAGAALGAPPSGPFEALLAGRWSLRLRRPARMASAHIVSQYLPEEEMAERVYRAVPAIGVALLIGAGVLMGRMLS